METMCVAEKQSGRVVRPRTVDCYAEGRAYMYLVQSNYSIIGVYEETPGPHPRARYDTLVSKGHIGNGSVLKSEIQRRVEAGDWDLLPPECAPSA